MWETCIKGMPALFPLYVECHDPTDVNEEVVICWQTPVRLLVTMGMLQTCLLQEATPEHIPAECASSQAVCCCRRGPAAGGLPERPGDCGPQAASHPRAAHAAGRGEPGAGRAPRLCSQDAVPACNHAHPRDIFRPRRGVKLVQSLQADLLITQQCCPLLLALTTMYLASAPACAWACRSSCVLSQGAGQYLCWSAAQRSPLNVSEASYEEQ